MLSFVEAFFAFCTCYGFTRREQVRTVKETIGLAFDSQCRQ